MKSSKIVPVEDQEHFWSVVRKCVRAFHAAQSVAILSRVNRLRKKVEQLPTEEMELFFHSEPFDVACRVAERLFSAAERDECGLVGRPEHECRLVLTPRVLEPVLVFREGAEKQVSEIASRS